MGLQQVRGFRRWRPAVIGIGLALQLLIASCGDSNGGPSGQTTEASSPTGIGVPDVIGLTTAEADVKLLGAGLLLEVTTTAGEGANTETLIRLGLKELAR